MLKKVFVILLLMIVLENIRGQEIISINYSISDNLLSSSVNVTFQDKQGYIWIGTNYGVSKFDGYKFINYTATDGLLHNNILDIYEDETGKIWFITSSFYLTYIKNDTIHQYKYNDIIQKELYNNSLYVKNSFSVENDKVVFGIENRGLFTIYRNGNIKLFYNDKLLNNNIVIVNNKNNVFALKSKSNNGIMSFVSKCSFSNKSFVYKTNLFDNNDIVVEQTNNIFFLAHNKKIFIFKDNNVVDSLSINDKIIYLKKLNNNLWISTLNNGVFIYKIINNKLIFRNSLLKNVIIKSIIIDKEKSYWLSSENKGVFYIPDLNVYSYNLIDDNSKEKITDIISFNGSVYVAKNSGILLNITTNKKIIISEDFNLKIMKLAKTDDRLIISYGNKIYSLSDNDIVKEIFNVDSENISGFFIKNIEIESNRILLSSNADFLVLEDDRIKKIFKPDRKFKLIINKTLMINKTTFVASENGLFKYSNENLYNYGEKNSLLNISINDIFFDRKDDNIFLATSGYGLLCIKNDSIINYVNEDLSSKIIFSICDKDSFMVVSSNRGVDIINFDRDMNLNVLQKYNKQYGLISNVVKKIICEGNSIYTMSEKGINKIKINKDYNLNIRPSVYIKQIHINEIDTVKYNNCKLSYDQNHISFSFIGLSYKNAGNIRYKYKLKGSSSNWVISKSTNVEYPYLPVGKYKFIVYASNEDGKWSNMPDSFSFEIVPPFWRTWWFIIIIVFLVLLLILIIIKLLIFEIKRKEELKKNLYMYRQQALRKQMNPHFIFNALNSIQHYILQNDKRMSNKYLNKFSSLIRIVLENSQNNLITLERELYALRLYLEIESTRFKDKFVYKITIDEDIDEGMCKIPPLLLQPYVENAIWHGLMNKDKDEIGMLNIDIKLINGVVHCFIVDNGVGREKATELVNNKNRSYEALGTKLNNKRVEAFNYSGESNISVKYVDLKDSQGNENGTKVIITLRVIS